MRKGRKTRRERNVIKERRLEMRKGRKINKGRQMRKRRKMRKRRNIRKGRNVKKEIRVRKLAIKGGTIILRIMQAHFIFQSTKHCVGQTDIFTTKGTEIFCWLGNVINITLVNYLLVISSLFFLYFYLRASQNTQN